MLSVIRLMQMDKIPKTHKLIIACTFVHREFCQLYQFYLSAFADKFGGVIKSHHIMNEASGYYWCPIVIVEVLQCSSKPSEV